MEASALYYRLIAKGSDMNGTIIVVDDDSVSIADIEKQLSGQLGCACTLNSVPYQEVEGDVRTARIAQQNRAEVEMFARLMPTYEAPKRMAPPDPRTAWNRTNIVGGKSGYC